MSTNSDRSTNAAIPNILLCNDDGIFAPGIAALHRAVGHLGQLTVAAPDVERSATGHAITLEAPIRCKQVQMPGGDMGNAIGGTPADCVKLAVRELMKDTPPDIVLSGINIGANTGISVLYSGTVSAASEAAIHNIPSIAFSLCSYTDLQWEVAGRIAAELTEKFLKNPPPAGILLNVNIPNLPYDEIKGIRATQMGRSRFIERFHERQDPRGGTYYWLDGELQVEDPGEAIDVHAVADGYISITPIQLDRTAYDCMAEVDRIYST